MNVFLTSTWITQVTVLKMLSVELDNGVSMENVLVFLTTALKLMKWDSVLFALTKTTDFTKDNVSTLNPALIISTLMQEDSVSMSVPTVLLGTHPTDSASPAN
jgi:hypothetical protein